MRTLVMAALIALLVNPWISSAAENQRLVFKANGEEPVIFFTRLHHRVIDVNDHQELSVFADGRVRVHNPDYMKHSGTFEYRLSDKAMQSLLSKLDANGLMTFDQNAVRAAHARAHASQLAADGERFHVSDLTASHIYLNFSSFGKSGMKGKAIRKKIVWNDIPIDAARYPDISGLTRLAQSEQILLRLTEHTRRDAVRINGGR